MKQKTILIIKIQSKGKEILSTILERWHNMLVCYTIQLMEIEWLFELKAHA